MIEAIVFKGLKDLKDLGSLNFELPPTMKYDLFFFKKKDVVYIAEPINQEDNKQRYNFIIAYEVKK